MNTLKRVWRPVYQAHRGASIIICKVIIAAMMGCVGFGFAQFVSRLAREAGVAFYPGYLTLFAISISAEAMYTHRRAADLDGRDKLIFRAAEGLTLIIVFKFYTLLRVGFTAMLGEISRWQTDFAGSFFSAEFISGGLILVLVWVLSTNLANEIDDLHDREQDATWDELGIVQNALHLFRNRIMGYAFGLGALVLFFAVGSRLNVRAFVPLLSGRFDPSVPILNVLIYFVLTLVLLSQTQFALLRTRWLWSKTPVAQQLARNWLLYGTIFFIALAILSFVLPTSYSLGFFDTLRYLMNVVGEIFRFIIMLILLPFTLCAKLFNVSDAPQEAAAPAATPPPPPVVADSAPSALWQFIQSLLFWGTLLAVVIFALSQYIKANAFLLRRFARLPFLKWIATIARGLWSWIVGANRTVTALIGAGIRRLRPSSETVRRLENILRRPAGRTPREQVIEIYLTLVELGHKHGPSRRNSETPYQYSRDVISVHPDVSNEVMDLTEAFNEARYSDHPVQTDTVSSLRAKWDRIRTDLEKPPPDIPEQAEADDSSSIE
jgi:hypothetical protein